MTLTHVGTTAQVAGTTSATPTFSTHATGDILVVYAAAKPTSTGTPPVFSIAGPFFPVPGAAGSSGSAAAQGADVGQTWHAAWYTEALAAGTTAPLVTVTNGNVCLVGATVIGKDDTKGWEILGGTGADTTDGSAQSLAMSAVNLASGDFVIVFDVTAGNTTRSSPSLTATGMTFGTYTEQNEGTTTTGNDLASAVHTAAITAGTAASVAATHATTLDIATAGHTQGSGCIIRIREGATADFLRYGVRAPATGAYLYTDAGATDYVVPANAQFRYEIQIEGSIATRFGVDFDNTAQAAALRDQNINDQNGVPADSNTADLTTVANGQWYSRIFSIPGYSGQTIAWVDLVRRVATTADLQFARFRNIRFTDASGNTLKNIWSVGDPKPVTSQHLISGAPVFQVNLGFETGQSANLGQVVETSSAFAITKTKDKTLGLLTTAESSFALARAKEKTLGLASGTDAGFGITRLKERAIGQPSTSDTAFVAVSAKQRELGLVVGTESALVLVGAKEKALELVASAESLFALTRLKELSIGLTTTTESLFALSGAKEQILGLVSGTDTGLALTRLKESVLGLVTSTDSGFEVLASRSAELGLATTSDSLLAVGQEWARELGLIAGVDSAQSFERSKTATLGLVLTADETLVALVEKSRALDLVQSVDSLFGLVGAKERSLGLVSSTDSALDLTAEQAGATMVELGVAIETAATLALASAKALALALVATADTSHLITATNGANNIPLGLAFDTGAAFSLAALRSLELGQTLSADSALAILLERTVDLGVAAGAESALSLDALRQVALGQAQGVDVALAATASHVRLLGLLTTIDTVWAFGMTGGIPLRDIDLIVGALRVLIVAGHAGLRPIVESLTTSWAVGPARH